MGEPVEESGGHLGIAEDARPLAEGEVAGDDDRGAFIEPADQMEQRLAAGLGKRQIPPPSGGQNCTPIHTAYIPGLAPYP